LAELVHAIREYRKSAESKPLTLHGSEFQELDWAIDRAEGLLP